MDSPVNYEAGKKVVHYGSLEEKERANLEKGTKDDSPTLQPSVNINVGTGETIAIEETKSGKSRSDLLQEFERRKRGRTVVVSTDDAEVKRNLRQLGEPICLFGEGPADRRERLRSLLSILGEDAIKKRKEESQAVSQAREAAPGKEETTWYHEGPQSLKEARRWLAEYSLPRARDRVAKERKEVDLVESSKLARLQDVQKLAKSLTIHCSQIGDERPISHCAFSPNDKLLATASWSGLCKLWDIPSCEPVRTLRGHNAQVGCIEFHPLATLSQDPGGICIASCGHDGSVKLWNLENEEPIADIEGHAPYRVSRLSWHPSGRFMGTACHDSSWRLWDLEVCEEILHQEGHSRAVFDIKFNKDGSLAASGGLDAYGRVWDLRTGRCIMFLQGHLKSVLCVDFSSNGFHIATASEDNTAKIWDLRQRKILYTIPAHNNLLTHVKYEKTDSKYLLTASYDSKSKIWMNPSWTPLKSLEGHESKIMGVDVTKDSKYIASASYDRTFKLWTPES